MQYRHAILYSVFESIVSTCTVFVVIPSWSLKFVYLYIIYTTLYPRIGSTMLSRLSLVVRNPNARNVQPLSDSLVVRHSLQPLLGRTTTRLQAITGQYLSTASTHGSNNEGGGDDKEQGRHSTSRARDVFGFTFFGSLVRQTVE